MEACIHTRSAIVSVSILATILSSCSGEITPMPVPANESMPEKSALPSASLFLDGESPVSPPSAQYVARTRVVKINFPLLLDENGHPRQLPGNALTLNLFPDVIYTGVIEQVEENGDSYVWIGQLKDVAYSGLTMILTDGIFIAKIASPDGVYEVSNIGEDLYRVILINQQDLPGGEDAIDITPVNP